MASKKNPTPSTNKNISINGDVKDSVVIIGDNNKTFFQKVINIFKSDSETLEHRNRRILLGHVENAWIKGVLDASLHGAALLDLGIKEDPEAVTKYPWAIKKESTDETLPAGTSMLEIFDSIGMGRSLLILGAPGSGKTTMLLELARQLIARAREDVTQPIPMVFNLASWTEKLTLADWLAQELNNLYSVPRKISPDWVKGDKLLLLLDGLDEVRQESRGKCVEKINEFRKEHGLTSLAVCSRSQDYADLNAKLSFEGAIDVQPLTQEQITEFFNRFGDEMVGIKQVLKKDSALREMAETPLFLSIMLMTYRGKQDVDIWISQDEKAQRRNLFDTYTGRMFERPRLKRVTFKKQDVLRWLSWLASRMSSEFQMSFSPPKIATLLPNKLLALQNIILLLCFSMCIVATGGLFYLSGNKFNFNLIDGIIFCLMFNIFFGMHLFTQNDMLFSQGISWSIDNRKRNINITYWNWKKAQEGFLIGLSLVVMQSLLFTPKVWLLSNWISWIRFTSGFGLYFILLGTLFAGYLNLLSYLISLVLISTASLLPISLVPFLDHCVDLIFLRRVGGGYIFVHRLLMEHFAELYVETQTSKGN